MNKCTCYAGEKHYDYHDFACSVYIFGMSLALGKAERERDKAERERDKALNAYSHLYSSVDLYARNEQMIRVAAEARAMTGLDDNEETNDA